MVIITLPDREERLELVGERIKRLGMYFKIADNVCPVQIAELTKNFTEDELCQLVRDASSWAMTRSSTINPDGLLVTQEDFLRSLKAIQPRYGVQAEKLELMMPGGFHDWIRPVQQVETKPNDRQFEIFNIISEEFKFLKLLSNSGRSLEVAEANESRLNNGTFGRGEEAAGWSGSGTRQNVRGPDIMNSSQFEDMYVAELLVNSFLLFAEPGGVQRAPYQGLLCQLIEGASKSGISAIAARFAQKSNVPFVKVILPEDFLGASVSQKCEYIRKLLEDAYDSQDGIVIFDDLERLLEYDPLGKNYSNEILQTLMVLLKKQPPRGHKLHILCTSSRRDVLEELGMLSVFTSVTHVPNLSRPEHILSVAVASQRFEREELLAIEAAIVDKPISIGIKRLLDLIIWVNPLKPDRRVAKFLERMGAEMGWEKNVGS